MRIILHCCFSRLWSLLAALPFVLISSAQAQSALGNALTFNGTQYVTVSNFGAIIPTNEITVEFWANTVGYAGQSAFMLSPDQGTNRFNAHIDYGSTSGTTYWDFGNISGPGRVSAPSSPNSLGNWVHYALVASQSGGYMRIYTNGVLQINQANMTPFVRGNYNLQIGGPGFPYNGTLDELRVWSVARTQGQIQSDLYTPLMGSEPNLVVYYKFDSASGTVATNSATATGPAYNGIVTGSPSWVASTIPVPINPVSSLNDLGIGSLRYAVSNLAAGSTIMFSGALSGQVISLTNGQIELSKNVTIDASALAGGVQINGNGNSRIFQVDASETVVLNALTLTNGNAHGSDAVFANGGDGMGGGVYNLGTLTVSNCTFVNDTTGGGNANTFGEGGSGFGGAIYNAGTLTVNGSTLAYGNATGGYGSSPGGGNGFGAGIYNAGTLNVNNSTLAGNNASGGSAADEDSDGGNGAGGAIYNSGALTLNNNTLANNSANGNPGGQFGSGGSGTGGGVYSTTSFHLTNSIVCSNTAGSSPNISGSYTSANNLVDANALLAPLGNYGGPTQTMPPEPGSPALGAGNVAAASQFSTDQRGSGYLRVVSGKVDIGSVEIQSGQSYPIVLNTLDSGPGSLREVVSNAPAGATVTFDASLSGQTIALTTGQIILSNSVFIYGTGLSNGVQISGSGISRIFQVNTGTTAIMGYLTLTNGNPGSANYGGAILNASGTLLELAACTFANNSSGQGGAIENEGTCVLIECTMTGNHAVTTGGASGNGGAIDNNQGPLQLLQCTIVSNTAGGNGGGVANFLTTLAITNSIIANNTPQDTYNFASSTINAGGTNIVISGSQQVGSTNNGGGSLLGLPPMLAPLGNYGGPTPTMPPLRGSPAIDGGSTAAEGGITTDQRGLPRVSGARVDIGAVEIQIANAPFDISEITHLANNSVQLDFSNLTYGSFTVFATTNVVSPFNTWSNLGPALELPSGSGQFQFTDLQAANFSRRFYRVSSP